MRALTPFSKMCANIRQVPNLLGRLQAFDLIKIYRTARRSNFLRNSRCNTSSIILKWFCRRGIAVETSECRGRTSKNNFIRANLLSNLVLIPWMCLNLFHFVYTCCLSSSRKCVFFKLSDTQRVLLSFAPPIRLDLKSPVLKFAYFYRSSALVHFCFTSI